MPEDIEARLERVEADISALQESGDQSLLSTSNLMRRTAAQLPTGGVGDGAIAWASDGRGPSEGAGAGTGTLVFFHSASREWRDFRTGTAVLT